MSRLELRRLELGDAHAHELLMAHAFGRGRVVAPPPEEADEPKHLEYTWGLFDGGALRASLVIPSFSVYWGSDRTFALGGIAGVATWAEARGQGLVGQLMAHALTVMREAGQFLSALFPFSWDYYRQFGWDWVGEKRLVTLPLRELARAPRKLHTVRLIGDEGKREALTSAYASVARGYRGAFTEESHQWDGLLGHHRERTTFAYGSVAPGGAVDGYLLWRFPSEEGPGQVREYIAATTEADRTLLGLLRDLGMQCARARLTLPSDHPLWSHRMHVDLETRLEPVFAARVVDVARAMEALDADPALAGSVLVTVRDAYAGWNDGLFRVTAEEGKVVCTPAVGAVEPAVSLDIQAFSQAFWGQPSLSTLRRAGRLQVRDESGFGLLSRLLPPAPVFSWDDF